MAAWYCETPLFDRTPVQALDCVESGFVDSFTADPTTATAGDWLTAGVILSTGSLFAVAMLVALSEAR
jgi:hypothetical protein